jgi:Asp-tRNA(Asn)/Glu-tRNA(Gln) amidotransferase A subunit family amidase
MSTRTRTEGFGDVVQRRIILGTYGALAGYYDAYTAMPPGAGAFASRLRCRPSEVDLIAGRLPDTAFRVGEMTADPLQMYLMDNFTFRNMADCRSVHALRSGPRLGLPWGTSLGSPLCRGQASGRGPRSEQPFPGCPTRGLA